MEDRRAAAEVEEPADELRCGGDGEGHPQAAALLWVGLLARMPGPVLYPGGGRLVEKKKLHGDGLPPHDPEGVADIRLQVEMEGKLERAGILP